MFCKGSCIRECIDLQTQSLLSLVWPDPFLRFISYCTTLCGGGVYEIVEAEERVWPRKTLPNLKLLCTVITQKCTSAEIRVE